jgi:hypothetical protein
LLTSMQVCIFTGHSKLEVIAFRTISSNTVTCCRHELQLDATFKAAYITAKMNARISVACMNDGRFVLLVGRIPVVLNRFEARLRGKVN